MEIYEYEEVSADRRLTVVAYQGPDELALVVVGRSKVIMVRHGARYRLRRM